MKKFVYILLFSLFALLANAETYYYYILSNEDFAATKPIITNLPNADLEYDIQNIEVAGFKYAYKFTYTLPNTTGAIKFDFTTKSATIPKASLTTAYVETWLLDASGNIAHIPTKSDITKYTVTFSFEYSFIADIIEPQGVYDYVEKTSSKLIYHTNDYFNPTTFECVYNDYVADGLGYGSTRNILCYPNTNIEVNAEYDGGWGYFISVVQPPIDLSFYDNLPIQNYSDTKFGKVTRVVEYHAGQLADWLWISSPFNAKLMITYSHNGGDHVVPNAFVDASGPCYILRRFNGEKRAAGASINEYWEDIKDASPTLTDGVGYILGIDPRGYTSSYFDVKFVSVNSENSTHVGGYASLDLTHHASDTSEWSNTSLIGTGLFVKPETLNFTPNKIVYFAIPPIVGEKPLKYKYEFSSDEFSSNLNNLRPFLSFFVQTHGNEDYTLNFAPTTNTSAAKAPMARAQQEENSSALEMYQLNLTNDSISETTTIFLSEEGSEGYTAGEDFFYFTEDLNGVAIPNQFYSLDLGEPRSFNHRKLMNQSIILGGVVDSAATYTISLNKTNTSAKSVILTDYDENVSVDLLNGDYLFTAERGSFTNRFVVTFTFAPETPTENYIVSASGLIVSGNAASCIINNAVVGEVLYVFDAMGRCLYKQVADSDNIILPQLPAGTYMIRSANQWVKVALK